MAITRWDPFRDVFTLQSRMNSLLQDYAREGSRQEADTLAAGAFVPPVDIYEDAEKILLTLEVPGIPQALTFRSRTTPFRSAASGSGRAKRRKKTSTALSAATAALPAPLPCRQRWTRTACRPATRQGCSTLNCAKRPKPRAARSRYSWALPRCHRPVCHRPVRRRPVRAGRPSRCRQTAASRVGRAARPLRRQRSPRPARKGRLARVASAWPGTPARRFRVL